jgi:hypothetical protein
MLAGWNGKVLASADGRVSNPDTMDDGQSPDYILEEVIDTRDRISQGTPDGVTGDDYGNPHGGWTLDRDKPTFEPEPIDPPSGDHDELAGK